MSVLAILIYGDDRLRQIARPVGGVTPAIRALAADMIDTMYDAPGRGLAAPQVGQLLRMFVMDCHWKDRGIRAPLVVINPQIVAQSDDMKSYDEGCLSIPGLVVPVQRPAQVTLRWHDLEGAAQERQFDGFEAVCVQHEYDHLDGVLSVDRIDTALRTALEPDLMALSA